MRVHEINLPGVGNEDGLFILNHVLHDLGKVLRDANFPTKLVTPLGTHGVQYDVDEDGVYARIGMSLPEGAYAEVDDGTYGTLNAFRVYLTDDPTFEVTDDADYAYELSGNKFGVRDPHGNRTEDVAADDPTFASLMEALLPA
jgi:hypothetical protein